jgi:cyclin C
MKTANIANADSLYHDAWRVINDSLRTDVSLLYYPHQIALAAIFIAAMLTNRDKDKELNAWLTDFSVDFERLFEIVKMILEMYKLVKGDNLSSVLKFEL